MEHSKHPAEVFHLLVPGLRSVKFNMADNVQFLLRAASKELIKPRRKRGRFMRLEFPFPVPEQKNPNENKWYYYQGFLRSNCVAVENVGDLTLLYKMVRVNYIYFDFYLFYYSDLPSIFV